MTRREAKKIDCEVSTAAPRSDEHDVAAARREAGRQQHNGHVKHRNGFCADVRNRVGNENAGRECGGGDGEEAPRMTFRCERVWCGILVLARSFRLLVLATGSVSLDHPRSPAGPLSRAARSARAAMR